jgi:predicted dehydrogenase
MDTPQVKPLREAIVGVGALVFKMHEPAFALPGVEVVGACDINPATGEPRAQAFGCPFYTDYRQMLAEVRPDVTVVMTPHYIHAQIAIDALHAGSHVLTEKPMALQVSEADAMVQAAADTGRILAVNFQHRQRPEVKAAKQLIIEGRLGKLQRIKLITPWPRSEKYYGMATWRATWWGEGGGVLMNQAPHDLDLVCHLMGGAPDRVLGSTHTNLHHIQVEDTASAIMEWANGATGYLYVSTTEAGPKDEVEIVGTRGILRVGEGTLTFLEYAGDVHEWLLTGDAMWQGPELTPVSVQLSDTRGDHVHVHQDLHAAIREGRQPLATGAEGRMSLELANAINYSSHLGAPVSLPIDRAAYAALLARLISENRG